VRKAVEYGTRHLEFCCKFTGSNLKTGCTSGMNTQIEQGVGRMSRYRNYSVSQECSG